MYVFRFCLYCCTRILFNNFNLRLKQNTEFFIYAFAHKVNQVKHIRACCSAAIDDEPRMLRADFRPADSCAFEPRLFYQRTCEMPLGPFKSASCGRILKRLLFFAAHIEFLHSTASSNSAPATTAFGKA